MSPATITEPRSVSCSSALFKRLEFDDHTLSPNFSPNMRRGLQVIISSFQDTPIENHEEDTMGIGVYAESLSHFISSCQAPMTVGIQGNWGTGKTSLMKLLQKQLNQQGVRSIWINSWEHSVFVDAADITPQILLAMAAELNEIKRLGNNTVKEKAASAAEDFFGVGKNAFNQFFNRALGVDVQKALDEEHFSAKTSPVGKIRNAMRKFVTEVVDSDANAIEKVVFFVDDLDRIKPSEAVEVIEALKNVFDDIPYCVFVLAIDYEVIKKGLKTRYDTQDSDREFKSFFDKMIQVPFRMPTAAMQVNHFIEATLVQLGIHENDKYFSKYANILTSSIGHNPRSLKRFFNTYSLQKHMLSGKDSIKTEDNKSEANYLMAMLNAMEIAFPHAWEVFLTDHDFNKWPIQDLPAEVAEELNIDLEKFEALEQTLSEVLKLDTADPTLKLFNELNSMLSKSTTKNKNMFEEVLGIVKTTSIDDANITRAVNKRDYTKFLFNGEALTKGRYIHAIVKSHVESLNSLTVAEFRTLIPQKIKGYGIKTWVTYEEAKELQENHKDNRTRYFLEEDEIIHLQDEKVCFARGQSKDSVPIFQKLFKDRGINIE